MEREIGAYLAELEKPDREEVQELSDDAFSDNDHSDFPPQSPTPRGSDGVPPPPTPRAEIDEFQPPDEDLFRELTPPDEDPEQARPPKQRKNLN